MNDELIPAAEVWQALEDGLAIAREFDGQDMAAKLDALGLSSLVVGEVVAERWATYKPAAATDRERALFAGAFAEGLIAGRMLRPESRV